MSLPRTCGRDAVDFFMLGSLELRSSASVRSAIRSSEVDTTGNANANTQPVSTRARDRRDLPERLETRQQFPSATSARASHRRLSSSSICRSTIGSEARHVSRAPATRSISITNVLTNYDGSTIPPLNLSGLDCGFRRSSGKMRSFRRFQCLVGTLVTMDDTQPYHQLHLAGETRLRLQGSRAAQGSTSRLPGTAAGPSLPHKSGPHTRRGCRPQS